MAGRYGGQIKRRGQPNGWRVARDVLETIGREALPRRAKRSRHTKANAAAAPG